MATMKETILQAIKTGYRHFDTAALYQSEHPLGEAIYDALRLGLITSRDELFITSKLWCSDSHHDCVLPALQKTLRNLKLEYLDLYLVHWPVSLTSGVSNFSCKELQTVLSTAKIPPAVNQVEMNPLWQQEKLRKFCNKKAILIIAYSPLGAKGALWGSNRVCLRWAYEQGICVLVKSFNKERMKENLDIFNWKLSPEESHQISLLPQRQRISS
ncbi:hypothetical protein DITRI_Ditri17bG0099300 [Diplodiscus trichospermus]